MAFSKKVSCVQCVYPNSDKDTKLINSKTIIEFGSRRICCIPHILLDLIQTYNPCSTILRCFDQLKTPNKLLALSPPVSYINVKTSVSPSYNSNKTLIAIYNRGLAVAKVTPPV